MYYFLKKFHPAFLVFASTFQALNTESVVCSVYSPLLFWLFSWCETSERSVQWLSDFQKSMKVRGKGGLLDFSKDERNKENSFLDVDWMITELINYGHEKMVPNDSDSSPNDTSNAGITPRRSASFKSPITKPKKVQNNTVGKLCRSLWLRCAKCYVFSWEFHSLIR